MRVAPAIYAGFWLLVLIAAAEQCVAPFARAGGARIQVRRLMWIPYELECWAPQDQYGVWHRYRPELVRIVKGAERENLGTVVPGTCVRVWESDAPFFRLKCKDHATDFPGSWTYSQRPVEAKDSPPTYSQPTAAGCWVSADFAP